MSEPNQTTTPDSSETKGPKPAPRERNRLLLVEGDGFTRLILLLRLRMAGFQVDFTSNGVLALTKLRSRQPDALIVDVKLRGLSGIELIKQARRDPAFGSRPIYVFTDVSQMNRSTRKEVRMVATKVFDKRGMSRENLVFTVATELRKPEGNGEVLPAEAAAANGSEIVSEMILPGEIEEIVHGVRAQTKLLTKGRDVAARVANCGELLSRVCSLASCAEAAGLRNLARQAKALEAFLGQLCKQGKEFADSALHTVTRAVEVMGLMCAGTAGKQHNVSQFTAVVIDEVPPSNEAISEALFNAGFNPASFEDPARAREHLASNPTHLVVANVLVPELHGLTLPKIRQLPGHATTPVIFIQPPADGQSHEASPTTTPRLDSNPVQLMELVMKALNEVQGTQPAKQGAPASTSSTPDFSLEETDFYTAETNPDPNQLAEPSGIPNPVEDTVVIQAPFVTPPAPVEEPLSKSPEAPANLQPIEQPIVQQHEQHDGGNEKKTVLFVEDDPFVVKAYKKCLKREGFEVEVAEDGVVALEMLPAVKPDVVILDLMLPKLHGLEVLKFMRGDDNLKDTPVLVLSNAYLEGLAVKANQAGANKGMLKTHCSPDKLVDEVCGLLGRPRQVPPSPPILKEPAVVAPLDDAVSLEQTAIWTRQSGMRKDAPKEIAKIRRACLEYIKANGADESLEHLTNLYRWVRFLGARASLSGFTKIAELSSALEGLLFQIVFKQTEPAPSTFQTIAQAVDCLDRLIQNRDTTYPEPRTKPKMLVVDDDSVCNFAMTTALKRAGFDAVGLQDPLDAQRMLEASGFDLILLDVNMPQLNGFELCENLRRMPQHKSVPVIFVTINAEFQNRARSVIAGGNDLMGKPVSPMELILKATMHLLNSCAQKAPGQTEPSKESDTTWALDAMHIGEPSTSVPDQFVSLPANSPEPAADLAVAASLPTESQQARFVTEPVAESEVDVSSRLSEAAFTETQTDAPRVETLHAQVSEPETTEVGTAEEQRIEAERPAAGATEADESASEAPIHFEAVPHDGGTSAAELTPAIQEGYEAPEKRFDDAEDDFVKPRVPAPTFEKERETLVSRIYTAENELFRTQARLERKEKAIESLQKQLEEFTALKTQLEQQETGKSVEAALHVSTQPGEHPEAVAAVKEAAIKAQKEAKARAEQLEHELAGLRQAREELNARILKEQQASAEASKRLEDFEKSAGQTVADLALAREELQKQKQEQQRLEENLRARLDAAVAEQEKAQSHCGQLEQELSGLRQAREELSGQVAKEQQVTAETGKRVKELEQQLGEKSAELGRARSEADQQAAERGRLETDLRAQLKAAATAQEQTQARCAELEKELAGLRQAREEITGQFTKEQQATAESGKRVKELEQRLDQSSHELERTRTELANRKQEQERIEADLRAQLKTAGAAQDHAQSRCGQLEQELAGLRHAREELDTRFTKELQVNADSGKRFKELEQRLAKGEADLERAQGELKKQKTEHDRAESDLRRQLEAAGALHKGSETAFKQAQARCGQLEQDLAELRRGREELDNKLVRAQRASAESDHRIKELENYLSKRAVELQRTKEDLEKQAQDRSKVESTLRGQLEAATVANKQSGTAHKEAQTRCSQLEAELASLRQAREEVTTKFGKEQQVAVESRARIKELEGLLGSKSAELERAQAESEKQTKARSQAEADLRQQLEKAGAAAQQKEDAHKQAQTRCNQLEQELAGLRQAREELTGKFGKEQQVTAESRARAKELEGNLGSKSAELEQARAELEKQAKAHSQAEAKLREQLEKAGAAARQNDEAHKQTQARYSQLEQDLTALRQACDELTGKFGKEQQVTAESRARIKELEENLSLKSAELEQTKADLENHAKDRNRVEAKLRQQLHKTSAAIQQNEDAQKQAQARYYQLELELVALRQAQQELRGNLGNEQQVAAESRTQIKDLETQLGSKSAELQRARAELEKQTKEHSQAEADLRQQLEKAGAIAKQNDEGQKQAHTRCTQLEQELAGLRQAREELTNELGKQRQGAEDSRAQLKQLEVQLGQRLAELDRAKTELQNQTRERSNAESELRRQLEMALAGIQQSEAAHKQTQARSLQLGQELAGLQQAHKELTGKFGQEQQATTDSRIRIKELEGHLGSKSADLERSRTELENQIKQHDRAQSDLRRQLADATAALQQREATHKQAHARSGQLEQELTELRQAREELTGRLAHEQQVTAQSRSRIAELAGDLALKSAELQKQTNEHGRVESDLRRQLEATAASFKQSQTAYEQALSQAAQLQQELSGHREAKEELSRKLAREQQAAAESRAQLKDLERRLQLGEAERGSQITELEQRVRQGVAALSRTTADLASERGERRRSEQTVAALNVRLQELHQDFTRAIETQRASHERIGNLEEQLRRTEQTVAQRTGDAEQQQTERRLAEDQLRKAKDQNVQFRKHLAFYEEANKRFDVTRQSLEAKLEASLAGAQEIGASLQREAAERQRVADTLEGVQRDLQNQSRKREALEKELETTFQGLQEREARFQKEAAERQNLAATLEAVQRELQYQSRKREELERELQSTLGSLRESEARFLKESAERQQLAQARDGLQSQLESQSQKRQALEAELQTTFGALHESEARFQKEMAERQKLKQALESAELTHRDRSKQSELECSRLQTALQFEQVERKRQESQMVRMRHFTLEAARGARALRNTLRRQVREPVDNLCQSARSLLELEMPESQKKLAQSVLEDVLLLNARLQETEAGHSDSSSGSPGLEKNGNGTNGSELTHDLTQTPA